jgi:hypothetical protein
VGSGFHCLRSFFFFFLFLSVFCSFFSKKPPSFIASLLLFCFCEDGSNQYSIRTAGGYPVFVWKLGWKEPLCHTQLLAVTIRVIWLVGFSVEVILPGFVQ